MRRLAAMVVAVGVVAGSLAAVVPSPVSAQEPLVGEQAGTSISCRASLWAPYDKPLGALNVANTTLWVRCYTPAGLSIDPARFVNNGNFLGNREGNEGSTGAYWSTCAPQPSAGHNVALGRVAVKCTQSSNFTQRISAGGIFVAFLTEAEAAYNSALIGDPRRIEDRAKVGATDVAMYHGPPEKSLPPPWPNWWPPDATPYAQSDTHTPIPRVACRVEQRAGAGGQVYADFRAQTLGSTPAGATDSVSWVFEWDEGPASPRGNPWLGDVWRDDRTVYPSGTVLGMPVPMDDVPSGGWWSDNGWWAQAIITRTWDVEVTSLVDQVTVEDIEMEYGGGAVLMPGVTEFLMPWAAPEGTAVVGQMYLVGDRVDTQRIVWTSMSAPCVVTVDPERAGTPTGDQEVVVTPATETDGGGGGGGDGGCERPSGWGLLNPFGWAGYGVCEAAGSIGDVLGNLLDAIGNLIAAIGNLVGELIDGLKDLFVPDDLGFDWEPIKEDAEGRKPFVYLAAGSDAVDDLLDKVDTRNPSCLDLGVPGQDEATCLEGPSSMTTGASYVRGLFIATLWIGVAVRIVRTAPWARGKDAGEPGG